MQQDVPSIEQWLPAGRVGAEVESRIIGPETFVTGVLKGKLHREPACAAKGRQHSLGVQRESAISLCPHGSLGHQQFAAFGWHASSPDPSMRPTLNDYAGERLAVRGY